MSTHIPRPDFVAFDERKAVRIYQRNLPHWRQAGVTYFVTFRLGDSIPEHVRTGWEDEKQTWLKAHGISYDGEKGHWGTAFSELTPQEQFRYQKHFNRAAETCLDRGVGCCALAQVQCSAIVRAALLAGDTARYHLGDFVIMPNHVHALVIPCQGEELELVLKGIKGPTALGCNRALGRSGTFWQADSYDHIVRSLEQLAWYCNYIAENPRLAGISIVNDAYYRAEWMQNWLAP
jgi:type I restriction enzyme R subunit